jgi:hypothetical protein
MRIPAARVRYWRAPVRWKQHSAPVAEIVRPRSGEFRGALPKVATKWLRRHNDNRGPGNRRR